MDRCVGMYVGVGIWARAVVLLSDPTHSVFRVEPYAPTAAAISASTSPALQSPSTGAAAAADAGGGGGASGNGWARRRSAALPAAGRSSSGTFLVGFRVCIDFGGSCVRALGPTPDRAITTDWAWARAGQ